MKVVKERGDDKQRGSERRIPSGIVEEDEDDFDLFDYYVDQKRGKAVTELVAGGPDRTGPDRTGPEEENPEVVEEEGENPEIEEQEVEAHNLDSSVEEFCGFDLKDKQ